MEESTQNQSPTIPAAIDLPCLCLCSHLNLRHRAVFCIKYRIQHNALQIAKMKKWIIEKFGTWCRQRQRQTIKRLSQKALTTNRDKDKRKHKDNEKIDKTKCGQRQRQICKDKVNDNIKVETKTAANSSPGGQRG